MAYQRNRKASAISATVMNAANMPIRLVIAGEDPPPSLESTKKMLDLVARAYAYAASHPILRFELTPKVRQTLRLYLKEHSEQVKLAAVQACMP